MLQPIGTAFAAAFARRTIYLTKVRTYIFPAIKISDVDQPRNLAKSVTVEWKIPFRRGGLEVNNYSAY